MNEQPACYYLYCILYITVQSIEQCIDKIYYCTFALYKSTKYALVRSNSSKLPCPTIFPSLKRIMRSNPAMEFKRYAMAMTVFPFSCCITAFITDSSVKLSIAEVASSKITSSESVWAIWSFAIFV